jgi:hypothetical protein
VLRKYKAQNVTEKTNSTAGEKLGLFGHIRDAMKPRFI